MTIISWINRFEKHPSWVVNPPVHHQIHIHPRGPRISLPTELLAYYDLCDGMISVITKDEDIPLSILPGNEVEWALWSIGAGALRNSLINYRDSEPWFWYLIGRGDTDEYVFMDLAPERYGYCYFNSFYFFGHPKFTWVIAHSFLELLNELYRARDLGEDWQEELTQGEKLEDLLK